MGETKLSINKINFDGIMVDLLFQRFALKEIIDNFEITVFVACESCMRIIAVLRLSGVKNMLFNWQLWWAQFTHFVGAHLLVPIFEEETNKKQIIKSATFSSMWFIGWQISQS